MTPIKDDLKWKMTTKRKARNIRLISLGRVRASMNPKITDGSVAMLTGAIAKQDGKSDGA